MCNPYLPEWEYIPDGEPHVFGDRLYVFGSHDKFAGTKFCMEDYAGWSAPLDNLNDWRYEGIIYKKTQHPGNEDGRLAMYAPDVCQGPDGRFYLYYSLADDVEMGVAVCDKPTGQYEFFGVVKHADGSVWGRREGDYMPFDPAVLVDDDGRVYLYAGQGPLNRIHGLLSKKTRNTAYVVELEPDMITMKTEPRELVPSVLNSRGTAFKGHEFFEANSIRKFNGKYYFIYSSVLSHELVYAISDRPDSGFAYGGILTSSSDVGLAGNKKHRYYYGNNHGSVAEINGKYYVFGHRHTNRSMFSRQGYADPIEMKADGHFVQAPRTSSGFDKEPARGFRACKACHLYSKGGATFSIEVAQGTKRPYITQEGKAIDPDNNNKEAQQAAHQYIANMKSGATAAFRYVRLTSGSRMRIVLRGSAEGYMVVYDMDNKVELGRVEVSETNDWTTYEIPVNINKDKAFIGFVFEGKGAVDFLEFG